MTKLKVTTGKTLKYEISQKEKGDSQPSHQLLVRKVKVLKNYEEPDKKRIIGRDKITTNSTMRGTSTLYLKKVSNIKKV